MSALGYTSRELKVVTAAIDGLRTGRVPVMPLEDWEIAERIVAELDLFDAELEAEERRAS